MTYSQSRGFRPTVILAWLRSEAAEGYRRTRTPGLMYDPWFGSDPDCQTVSAYAPSEVAW